jgi:predicted GNAT family acetyltransferase
MLSYRVINGDEQTTQKDGLVNSVMQVIDRESDGCYQGVIDDQVVGAVDYRRIGARIVIRHAVIEAEFRGEGLGTQLVRTVLDRVRERGEKVTNYCGFVAAFIADNPEYQSIVDADRPGVAAPATH